MPIQTEKPTLPLHLTSRDRELLKCVFDFRILTADLIQQLIPGSDQQILRRLQKLTAHRYLIRHQRSSAHLPYVYQLGQQAGRELTALYGIEPDRVKKRAQKISADTVQHALMISRVQFAATCAAAEWPDVELVDCVIEDELPYRSVAYQDGARTVKASFKHDILFILKHQGRSMTLPTEADRSTERGKVVESKIKAYHHFWLQEREKARRGEQAFFPFRVLWTTRSRERLENIRRHSLALNNSKGTGLHWFTCEAEYADPQRFFEPIWYTGRTGDQELHSLLESRRDRGKNRSSVCTISKDRQQSAAAEYTDTSGHIRREEPIPSQHGPNPTSRK